MRFILYGIASIMIAAWILSVFIYGLIGLIHILIVLALVSLLFGIFQKEKKQ